MSNNYYIDLHANGLGCHIVALLVGAGYCKNFNYNFVYKPLPLVHHAYPNGSVSREYNNRIEKMFNLNKIQLFNTNDNEIQYIHDIYDNKYFIQKGIEFFKNYYEPITNVIYEWVIHIRRNDISETQHTDRFVVVDRYNQLIRKIKLFYNGDIHIYTDGNKNDLKHLNKDQLIIHYKGDPLETFSIMSNCKNLVVGFSTFSYSAGCLNKNNVYYDLIENNFFHPYLDHWLKIKPHVKLDIGLSKEAIQTSTWLRKEPNLKVFGFEPHPHNLKRLYDCDCYKSDNRSILPNLHNRLTILPYALDNINEKKKMKLYVPNLDNGSSSLLKFASNNKLFNGLKETIDVDVMSLKMFFEENSILNDFEYIDYIKLDTQAKDLDIIKSAIDIIKDKVVWITAEGDGGYYDETKIDIKNRCNAKNIIEYMTDNNFVFVNHQNTSDPTFYNRKFESIKDDIFIFQH
jgi:FkbM family methyltransferase